MCVNKLNKSFNLLGERIRKLKGVKGIVRNLIPTNLGKAITAGLPGKGALSKVLGLRVKGLKFGRFLLGLSGPVGLAFTAASFLPDIYNFVKNTELGSKLISGLKDIGGSVLHGIKSLFGFDKKEIPRREVVKEVIKESSLSLVAETTREKILEKEQSKPLTVNVNINISNLTALNPEEIAEKIKAILIPEAVRATREALEKELYTVKSIY